LSLSCLSSLSFLSLFLKEDFMIRHLRILSNT
jgi:hypothetical protein